MDRKKVKTMDGTRRRRYATVQAASSKDATDRDIANGEAIARRLAKALGLRISVARFPQHVGERYINVGRYYIEGPGIDDMDLSYRRGVSLSRALEYLEEALEVAVNAPELHLVK